jgi:hypothetical protein
MVESRSILSLSENGKPLPSTALLPLGLGRRFPGLLRGTYRQIQLARIARNNAVGITALKKEVTRGALGTLRVRTSESFVCLGYFRLPIRRNQSRAGMQVPFAVSG